MDCLPLDEVCFMQAAYDEACEVAYEKVREPSYAMFESGDKQIFIILIDGEYEIRIRENYDE